MTPGYVPRGWKRGEQLVVTPASAATRYRGSISQANVHKSARGDHVAIVVFRADDGAKVEAWLAWWRGGAT